MIILLVDSYGNDASIPCNFNYFYDLICSHILNSSHLIEVINPKLWRRRYDELSDIIFDWDFDSLNDQSNEKAKLFDNIDLIFISGTLDISPWDDRFIQTITLLRMADITSKPVITWGDGTLASIYTCMTTGMHVQLLNPPIGNELKELAQFPTFTKSKTNLSGTWLDNETGDLYKYNPKMKLWIPVCNVGFHRYILNSLF